MQEQKRKKRSHSVASQCSMGHAGGGSRRTSRLTLQEPQPPDERDDLNEKQRRMVFIISLFGAGLFLSAVLLIVITLLLTPSIDERNSTGVAGVSQGALGAGEGRAGEGRLEAAEKCPWASSAMSLEAAPSTSQEPQPGTSSSGRFADKAVSTDDLRMASPSPPPEPSSPEPRPEPRPPDPAVSSVVANELLRLEAAINAMMAATADHPAAVEPQRPADFKRRPRSHSHHCFFKDAAAVHPRRSRRSTSAMIILHPKYGRHVPHPGCCMGAGVDTLSSVEAAPSEAGAASSHSSSQQRKAARKKRRKAAAAAAAAASAAAQARIRRRLDPDEMSKRARWTIMATACLLFFMCFLLVGITLRMTPIIDEMVRQENIDLMNSLVRSNTTVASIDAASQQQDLNWNATLPDPESTQAPLDQDKMNVSHTSRGD